MTSHVAEGMHMDQVDVRDLPEDQAQMVQAFANFLRNQMKKQAERQQHDTEPFTVWNFGTKSPLSRADIYERV
jgi:hypothetical protein